MYALNIAFDEALSALPDKDSEWIVLEGPFSPPVGDRFWRATMRGYLPCPIEGKGATAGDAMHELARVLQERHAEIAAWCIDKRPC